MFTGIVEGMGLITAIAHHGGERRFGIRPCFSMENIADGESIAVNGACLSVEKHDAQGFYVYASAETISRVNLGFLAAGAKVNLERALKLGNRLGGHIVSGHIDCMARTEAIARAGESLRLRLSYPAEFSGQVISKGSVALNGISLTVNACGRDFLEVNVIPDSQRRTNLRFWQPGTMVNMETDIIGKYAQHLLAPWQKAEGAGPGLNASFLAKHGFI